MLVKGFDRNKHDLGDIMDLLAMAIFDPTTEKLEHLVDEFCATDGRIIFVATDNGEVVGIIGMDYTNRPHGVITHIAVSPAMRKRGIGKQLINYATTVLKLRDVEVETDQDAIDFYSACGFKTKEIESQYPGVRRFRCVWRIIESK